MAYYATIKKIYNCCSWGLFIWYTGSDKSKLHKNVYIMILFYYLINIPFYYLKTPIYLYRNLYTNMAVEAWKKYGKLHIKMLTF